MFWSKLATGAIPVAPSTPSRCSKGSFPKLVTVAPNASDGSMIVAPGIRSSIGAPRPSGVSLFEFDGQEPLLTTAHVSGSHSTSCLG